VKRRLRCSCRVVLLVSSSGSAASLRCVCDIVLGFLFWVDRYGESLGLFVCW